MLLIMPIRKGHRYLAVLACGCDGPVTASFLVNDRSFNAFEIRKVDVPAILNWKDTCGIFHSLRKSRPGARI